MLKIIEGSYASFFPKEIDAMFRNRAETFSVGSAGRLWYKMATSETDSTTQTHSISYPWIPILKNTGAP